jgi:hypothetical protein
LLAVILAAASGVPIRTDVPIRNIHYLHRVDGRAFEFSTADVRAELGEIPLTLPPVRKWLQEFIAEGEENLRRKSQ